MIRRPVGILAIVVAVLLAAAAPAWAAFPTVGTTATSSDADQSGGVTINLPASLSSGDLIVCAATADNGAVAWDWSGASFTELYDQQHTGHTASAAYKVATGSEGSTITVSFNGSGTASDAACIKINTGTYSGTPAAGTPVTGNSTTPDPPSVNPSGCGTEDILWLEVIHSNQSLGTTASTNYGNLIEETGCSVGTCSVAIARRELNAASEDPGTATLGGAGGPWVANTIAICPTAPAATDSAGVLMVIE